jgi:endonuclease YncB( thermonuclease family)
VSKLGIIAFFGLVLAGGPAAAKPKIKVTEGQSAQVVSVRDADTILVRLLPEEKKIKVRVLGVDCPEGPRRNDPRNLGKAAAEVAAALLEGKEVKLETGTGAGRFKFDRFGRILAYLRLADGADFGMKMITDGHCGDFGWKHPHPRGAEYGAAEKKASRQATGL